MKCLGLDIHLSFLTGSILEDLCDMSGYTTLRMKRLTLQRKKKYKVVNN